MTTPHIRWLLRKYSILTCVVISVIFLVTASLLYPGGSILDKNSIGFDWSKNFFSNLFGENALNGAPNPARIWAIVGMAIYSLGNAVFFLNMSKKIESKHVQTVLKVVGYANLISSVLITTSLHDKMVTVSATLFLIGLFYITVFIFKTKLHFLKAVCVVCLLLFYFTLYLYGSGKWGLLAIMQKVSFASTILLVLLLEYKTKKTDFGGSDFSHSMTNATNR